MLWMGTALIRFAPLPTINSSLSNASELRLQSRHVVLVPMGNRNPMTRRDVAFVLPHLYEGCEHPQGGQPRTPQARGPAVSEFIKDLQLTTNDAALRASELTRNGTNRIDGGGGKEPTQGLTPLTTSARRRVPASVQ
jgi:hypothetical protein